jgi:hypothetical protein
MLKYLWLNFYYSRHVSEVHFWNVTTVPVATTDCIACRNRKAQKKSSENAKSCYYCCTARWIASSYVSFCSVASFLFSVRAKLNKKRQCVRKAILEVQVWWAAAGVEGQWTVRFRRGLSRCTACCCAASGRGSAWREDGAVCRDGWGDSSSAQRRSTGANI